VGRKSGSGPFNLTRIIEQRKYNSPKPLSTRQPDFPALPGRQEEVAVKGMMCPFSEGNGRLPAEQGGRGQQGIGTGDLGDKL
jgi:hypothetical protein